MTDRTESCTPEERRFLDLMQEGELTEQCASLKDMSATLTFDYISDGIPANPRSPHEVLRALTAARGDRD